MYWLGTKQVTSNYPELMMFSSLTHICGTRGEISQHIEAETKWPTFHIRHFQMHFLEWKYINSINISLKFVPGGQINNITALVQIMAWRRVGDKPLSEPMMVSLLMHICVTRPQLVNMTGLYFPLTNTEEATLVPIWHLQYSWWDHNDITHSSHCMVLWWNLGLIGFTGKT